MCGMNLLASFIVAAGIIAGSIALDSARQRSSTPFEFLAAAGTVSAAAPESCVDAINRAVQKQTQNDGAYTYQLKGQITGESVELYECFGATLKQNNVQRPFKKEHYECTGRSGTATVSSKGVTAVTTAQKGVPLGKCRLKVKNEDIAPAWNPTANALEKFPTPRVPEAGSMQSWYAQQWLVNNDITDAGLMTADSSFLAALVQSMPAWV